MAQRPSRPMTPAPFGQRPGPPMSQPRQGFRKPMPAYQRPQFQSPNQNAVEPLRRPNQQLQAEAKSPELSGDIPENEELKRKKLARMERHARHVKVPYDM